MHALIAVSALLLLASSGWAQEHAHGHHKPSAPARFSVEYGSFMGQMDVDMDRMMRDMHAPGYSGDPDIDFLAMMIPHHQGAIDMARLALIHGKDPLVRKLAEDIIASQQVEIEAMTRRLAILREKKDAQSGEFPALGGTRGSVPETTEKETKELQRH